MIVLASPDCPIADGFVPAKNFGTGPKTGKRVVTRVVIHTTDGGPDAWKTAEYFQTGGDNREVSAHFVVGRNGEIVQCVRLNDIAYHAKGSNANSVGIEHNARPPHTFDWNDAGLLPTEEQYRASAKLVAFIASVFPDVNLDRNSILGHSEIDPSRKADPEAAGWDWDKYMSYIQSAQRGMSLWLLLALGIGAAYLVIG